MSAPVTLSYDRGSLLLAGDVDCLSAPIPHVLLDPRTGTHRAQGRHYRAIVEHLIKNAIPFQDEARGWPNAPAGWTIRIPRTPFPHQSQAVEAWLKTRRGCVILPTGTGKSYVAVLALAQVQRPTLIVAPTIELMRQWHDVLSEAFEQPVGMVGGQEYDFQPITVTTYDSAYRHIERWGNQYGFVVFDECHHLPGPTYSESAIGALAPFRLGLTATPERADGGDALLPELIGPIVYRREIQELSGNYLAEYETRCIYVDLTDEERARYSRCREVYRAYLSHSGINLSSPNGWQRFVFEASQSPQGRAALKAWREMKHLERAGTGKFAQLEKLLTRHAADRTLIFTADNATVYQIARRYLVPPITHQTKMKERKRILERFHRGEYTIVVTSQVLNEGVDVPAAAVGIVLSGSGSTRENVQRLGRILRKHGHKQAILYEIVARGTGEEFTSERRRKHGAFGADD